MRNNVFIAGMVLLSILFSSYQNKDAGIRVVPEPVDMKITGGEFTISSSTVIVLPASHDASLDFVVKLLNSRFLTASGYALKTVTVCPAKNYICFKVDSSFRLNQEGYRLNITHNGILVRAKTSRGAFYAGETLLQLMPAQIENTDRTTTAKWPVPCLQINDYPRFTYRGMHLDAGRHFFPVDFILKQLDVMAMYKMNAFHWHLTEDQGWRIEIKKYPKLTEVGSKRIDGEGTESGGYYTQDDIRKIVQYAQERFIKVIPEIEMPGHSLAALAAYPELSCTGGPFKVRNFWGVENNVYCAGKEETFRFLEEVISEVADLFPSDYIHIGGDECPKDNWKQCPLCQARIKTEGLKDEGELQSYFIKRIEKILQAHGKKMIGWDEILEGGLAQSATVMSWRGEDGGITAANMGHDVIMTPGNWTYLDHYQGSPKVEPVAIGGYTTLEETYSYDPLPQKLPADKCHFVLGCQGNNWSEYLYSPDKAEYMIYPRIIALAEVNWTPKDKKNYNDFLDRMNNQFPRLDYHHINYHIPLPEGPGNFIAFIDTATLSFTTTRPVKMVYTLDGSDPAASSTEYVKPLSFTQNTRFKIRSVLPSGEMSMTRTITLEKQTLSPAADVESQPGMRMQYADGTFIKAEDIRNVTQWNDSIITDPKLQFDFTKPSAAVFTGYIEVPADGVYSFSSELDQVWIDGRLIINNDGQVRHYSQNDGSIALAKGKHALKAVFLNNIIGGWPSAWSRISISVRNASDKDFVPVDPYMFSY